MNKSLLKQIVKLAIKTKDFDKLKYIGQSLDCLLFEPGYVDLYETFRNIDQVLHENGIGLLGPLNNRNYQDLDNIGLIECVTFKSIEGNPVPSLDNNEIKFIIKVLEDNIIRIPTEKGSPESIISSIHNKRYKQLISKLQNGRETDKGQPKRLNITLPNSFFTYHGINPEMCDGYHCTCSVDGIDTPCSLWEEVVDDNGRLRDSYLG